MTTTRDEPTASSVFLYGAGRVGTAVAELLRRNDHELIGVASRTTSSENRASTFLGCPVLSPEEGASAASLVLLGIPDEGITRAADRVATSVTAGTVVCHFAGSFGVDVLRAVREAGARPAALHPVQACPDVSTAIQRLPGSAWGVTCGEDLKAWAENLVTSSLAGLPVVIDEDARPLWHAAAVTTSNGIAALLALGEELLSSIEVGSPDAVLGPLAEGTLANARAGGGGGATLTGPIARGESSTIERHIAALRSRAPQLVDPYTTMSRMILSVAARAGHLARDDESELRSLLDPT
jgi:predicted short-subunit dehydrogenase-like oxidoreductase (DUF2520 family)